MKKLKLDVSQLRVESFDAAATGMSINNTVAAQTSEGTTAGCDFTLCPEESMSCYYSCDAGHATCQGQTQTGCPTYGQGHTCVGTGCSATNCNSYVGCTE